MGRPDRNQIGDCHHYVPKLLLKNFTFGKKRKKRLFAFDKSTAKSFAGSVNDLAHEHGFNDIVLPDGKIFPMEPVLSGVDDDAAGPLRRLLEGRRIPAHGSSDRRTLAEFVAVQHLRVPDNRKLYECLNQLCVDALGVESELARSIGASADYTPQQAAFESAAGMMGMVPLLMESILAKEWMLLEAVGAACFCISDNPVALDNAHPSGIQSNIGFDVEGIEIYLPLASRSTLVMLCPTAASKNATAQAFSEALRTGTAMPFSDACVNMVNRMQVAFSERFVFQSSDDFHFARELLRKFSALSIGPRFSLGSPPSL